MRKFGKSFLVQLVVIIMSAVCAFSTVVAQPRPFERLTEPFRNIGRTVEADPNKEYGLTEAEGPYLIFAMALSGPTARQDANNLVLELRRTYRWNAYVFEKNFVRDANQDFGQARNPHSRTTIRYNNPGTGTEFAVMIGNFPSLEDNQFRRTLEEVRRCQPELLKGRTSATPFSMAHGVLNPMLPTQHQRGTVDAFIESINKDSPYSLLRNPRRYTVQIATFTGRAVMKPEDIQAIETGRNPFDREVSALEIGEQSAVALCKALRERGIEAYEFHDRHSSIVTVGSFDQPSRRMPDGTMAPDPHIQHFIQQFQGRVSGNSYNPVVIDGIPCDLQPRLIEVPRVVRR